MQNLYYSRYTYKWIFDHDLAIEAAIIAKGDSTKGIGRLYQYAKENWPNETVLDFEVPLSGYLLNNTKTVHIGSRDVSISSV